MGLGFQLFILRFAQRFRPCGAVRAFRYKDPGVLECFGVTPVGIKMLSPEISRNPCCRFPKLTRLCQENTSRHTWLGLTFWKQVLAESPEPLGFKARRGFRGFGSFEVQGLGTLFVGVQFFGFGFGALPEPLGYMFGFLEFEGLACRVRELWHRVQGFGPALTSLGSLVWAQRGSDLGLKGA